MTINAELVQLVLKLQREHLEQWGTWPSLPQILAQLHKVSREPSG